MLAIKRSKNGKRRQFLSANVNEEKKAEAQKTIDAWVETGDPDAPLDLVGLEDIPVLPEGLKKLFSDAAFSLPDLRGFR